MEIPDDSLTGRLRAAIQRSDSQKVAALIAAGADVQYQNENGYDALINAAYGEDESRLIEMLTLLISSGASATGRTTYNESAVRVLSRRGRFEAVQFLLQAGANPDDVKLTPLMEAVAFGTLADVAEVVKQGAGLEEQDYWARTAWLIAIQTGDVSKAKFLLEHGASTETRGRCGKPPLFYAIENNHPTMLKWLLEIGANVHQIDDFGDTALMTAAEYNNVQAVEVLLKAGAAVKVEGERNFALGHSPIWCADRFGQSLTFLADGRIVQIAGEHEDGSDPDFCIYNDVFVHGPDGGITIYGYPEIVFPPTDFHTATLIGRYIYLIGSLGYRGTRKAGETPVYRLDTDTFQMESISTTGDNPGWISRHRAVQTSNNEIQITGGKIITLANDREDYADSTDAYVLNVETRAWTVLPS